MKFLQIIIFLKQHFLAREFILFVVIGFTGFFIDIAILNFLIKVMDFDPKLFGFLALANIISTSFAVVFTFIMNRYVNFRTKENTLAQELSKYLISTGILWVLDNILYSLIIHTGLIPTFTKVIVYAILVTATYLSYRFFVFRR